MANAPEAPENDPVMGCQCHCNSRPASLCAGDHAEWIERVCLHCIDREEDWSVGYILRRIDTGERYKVAGRRVPGTDQDYRFEISTAESAALAPGEYRWTRIVKQCGKRCCDESCGCLHVHPDPEGDNCRTFNERMVAALEAAMENRATDAHRAFLEGHTFIGNSVSVLPATELQALLELYERRLGRDRQKERIRSGKKSRRNIKILFN